MSPDLRDYGPKLQALIRHLKLSEADAAKIQKVSCDKYQYDDVEWLVLDDSEANERVSDILREEYINGTIRDLSDADQTYFDIQTWVWDNMPLNRGELLAADEAEHEEEINNTDYYIYKQAV